jgi:hypothetical protein
MMEILFVVAGFLGLLAWGDLLVARLMPRHSDHALERALTGFGLLFGGGAYLIHGLGFLGLLYTPLTYAVALFCTAGIVLWLLNWWHGHLAREDAHATRNEPSTPKQNTELLPFSHLPLLASHLSLLDRLLLTGICLFAAVNLLGCLTPEIRDDCLINHLSIPASFANAHRIVIHPFNMNMGRPQMIHMYYLLSLLFQNVFGAKLIHSMIALVGLAAMGWLATRTCEKGALWPALYLFYSLPAVTLYATCSYIDLGRIYFEVYPLWLILRYAFGEKNSGRPQGAMLLLAAVIFGFGMGVHWLSSFFGWPALTATVFVAVLAAGGERRWKRAFLAATIFGLLSAVVFSPWIIRNWVFMGNPCQAVFRTPGGADAPQQINPDLGGYFLAIRELPQRLYDTFWVISASGNCPPILLLGVLILKFALRDRDRRRSVMLVFAILYMLLFAATSPVQDGRYILPGFAVSAILFFHYTEKMLANYRRYRPYLVGGILGLGVLNFAMTKYVLYADFGEPPWPVYSSAAVEKSLTERSGDRRMIHYLNEQLPPGSKVLLDTWRGPLYVWIPFMARNDMDPWILHTLLRRTSDNAALVKALRGWGLTHLVVGDEFPPNGLSEAQQARLREFVQQHLRLVHEVGDQRLYEIVN